METKTYYLGVDSSDTALKLIDSLSFFKVVDMKTAQVKYDHEDRMSLGIHSIKKPEGAIIFFTGSFTPKETAEIKALAKYNYDPMMESVTKLMTQTKLKLEKQNILTPHEILGQQTTYQDIDRVMSGESIDQLTDLEGVPGKTMTKFKQTIKSPHIHGAITAGFSIIAMALCSKYLCAKPIGYLSLAIPPFIATLHSSLLDKYKERRSMKTWYWVTAIIIATAVVIFIHL
ncbi:hypothetical protein ACFLTH_14760 [Bacteroidota bacterium]